MFQASINVCIQIPSQIFYLNCSLAGGLGDVKKMAGAFKKKHYVEQAEFRHLQRVVKSVRFRHSGSTTKGLLGEGSVRTIVNQEQMKRLLKNAGSDRLGWGPAGTWGKIQTQGPN